MKEFDLKTVTVLGMMFTFAITLSCGKTEESGKEGEQTPSPVISSVTIKPPNPLSSSTLEAVVTPQRADTEYAYRTLRAGFRLVFSPDIVVWHYAWRDAGQRDRQLRGYARSHGAFYGRYLRRGDAFMALKALIHLGRASRRWLRSSLAGDENLAAHGKAYTLQLLPGIIDGMRAEERETA